VSEQQLQASKQQITHQVKDYYSNSLNSSSDLKTSACCPTEAPPSYLTPLLDNIHPQIKGSFYGCGSPLPLAAEGCTVLDLGCGTGRNVYLLSQLVGEAGEVIGIDMTDKPLHIARSHIDWHCEKFAYASPNMRFKKGNIENLTSCGIKDNSIDIIISNCVINLSPDKEAVFKEIYRVLKPGGELYFSDVFADRRLPANLQQHRVLLGECLGGALYEGDFELLMQKVGFNDCRTVSKQPLNIEDETLKTLTNNVQFYSITVRSFKLKLEPRRENYAQFARYLGTIAQTPDRFELDQRLQFKAEVPVPVDGNTATILRRSRLAEHFKVHGETELHYGSFHDPHNDQPNPATTESSGSCC
jgi:ubiquinone/menaquinone biosynthesis C-methylase UbiE